GEVLRVLAEASPSALAFTKQQFYQLDGLSFDDGLRLGADVNAVSRSTPEFRAALSAFLKKGGEYAESESADVRPGDGPPDAGGPDPPGFRRAPHPRRRGGATRPRAGAD